MPTFNGSDGTSLFYRELGEGPPILFLSGLGVVTAGWDYQIAFFIEKGFRCVTFDRRGHGRSEVPSSGYDYNTFSDDIAALIEVLDLTGLTMVGHSMAGGEIIRYLSRHGDKRVARIVLIGASTPMLLESHDNPTGIPRAAAEALWMQWRTDYPKWIADNLPEFFVPETSRAMID
jgi:non-heme chloroperoxidase